MLLHIQVKKTQQTANSPIDSKTNQELDYFITWLEKADTTTSANITKELHDKYSNILQALGASQAHFLHRSRNVQNHTRHHLGM